jgi:glucose/arabinose dehydrogenase
VAPSAIGLVGASSIALSIAVDHLGALRLGHAERHDGGPLRVENPSVILHAQNSSGQSAKTQAFRYLVDTTPQTAPACTSPDSGLDGRPSNTTCIAPARPVTSNAMKFERVFPNVAIERAMQIAQPPGDGTRWFVFDREGKLWSFAATSPSATPALVADFATVSGKPVRTELSGGMLGFAFHPSFASNGRLYVTFTTSTSTGYSSEVGYLTSADGGRSFTSYTRVFGFPRAELEWNGGGIAFGKDGHLYLGFGASPTDGAQSKTSYFGKILRIDVNNPSGGRAYGIPAGNPFAAGGGAPEIYAWGFRQPWRMSFDRVTGELWVGDVGQASWEEVDRVELGKNYGWPCREGAHNYASSDPSKCPSAAGLVDPIFEYPTNGPAAVIGGYVYRGAAAPDFRGTYVYGDQVKQEAYAFRYDARLPEQAPSPSTKAARASGSRASPRTMPARSTPPPSIRPGSTSSCRPPGACRRSPIASPRPVASTQRTRGGRPPASFPMG